jgi:hypothetical protein
VDEKLDVVRPCQGVIAEGELHGRRLEILNPSGDDLWAFIGRKGLLRSNNDDMPGQLYLCPVGLLGRRLKIPGDHQLSRIGGGYRVLESSVVPAHPQRGPARTDRHGRFVNDVGVRILSRLKVKGMALKLMGDSGALDLSRRRKVNRATRVDFCYDSRDVFVYFRRKSLFLKEIWLGAESNRRHEDFQSSALPTELPSLKSFVIKYLQTNCFHRQRFVGNNV